MSLTAIRVENLSKQYQIGARERSYTTFREAISGAMTAPFSRLRRLSGRSKEDESFWALKDVSFDVEPGKVVGIIGRNGAGKSTLLKILSQITEPTSGRIGLNGRVGSLLEVGTGFHPELTGRENIYLNGAILGMKRSEIAAKFDEIVAFSEIEKFLDTPVKHYSSGMHTRLAFAVAAHLEPEILIVDEVLAVGDAEFQKKCLGKMGAVADLGRTVLLVSHNMTAVRQLCTTVIHLESGGIVSVGNAGDVVYEYLKTSGMAACSGEVSLDKWSERYGSGEARILSARLLDENRNVAVNFQRSRPMVVQFELDSHCRANLNFSAICCANENTRVLHVAHQDTPGLKIGVIEGRATIEFCIPALPLFAGNYYWWLAVHTEFLHPVDVVMNVLPFQAEDMFDSPRPYKSVNEHGLCWTQNTWSIKQG